MLGEQELAAEEEAQFVAISNASIGKLAGPTASEPFAREQQILDEMTELAESNRALPDARIQKLTNWITAWMCPDLGAPDAKWNNLRVLIFTEYDDTRRYVHQQLNAAISNSDRAEERIAIFHGPTPPNEREAIKLAFNTDPVKNPMRILIATDAAREGLNLQAHCWNVFHFDVPWNPSRMEQRNGRVDRKRQPNPKVYCHYFFYTQRPEDKVLAALVRKTKTIREELGSLSQVIDSKLEGLMKGGIRRSEVDALETGIDAADLAKDQKDTVEEELEAARERELELREAESKAMREILESQKKHLSETVARHQNIDQFHLFDEQEQRQLESNRRYWAKRLVELDGEMETEPDRIRDLYDVRAQRVEPVGMVYLWPITR